MDRITYELQYLCGYHYWVSVFDEPEWEICPVCGLGMEFRLFLMSKGEMSYATTTAD